MTHDYNPNKILKIYRKCFCAQKNREQEIGDNITDDERGADMDNGFGRDNVRIVGLIDWQLRVLWDRRR